MIIWINKKLTDLHFSLLPWPHWEPVSRPRASGFAARLSCSNLRRSPVFRGRAVGIRACPWSRSPDTPGRASDRRPVTSTSCPLAARVRKWNKNHLFYRLHLQSPLVLFANSPPFFRSCNTEECHRARARDSTFGARTGGPDTRSGPMNSLESERKNK